MATPVVSADAPAPIWRLFTGGRMSAGSPTWVDAGADGALDLVILAGGVLAAKRSNDILTWAADAVDITTLVGVADLDGDGDLEIVTSGGSGRVVIVAGDTGEVLFDESLVPAVGSPRIRDLDGDGTLDLFVPAAGCGSGGGAEGVALSFAGGVDNPNELWRLEPVERDYYCGRYLLFVDLDGNGTSEVLALGMSHAYAFSSTTGDLLFGSDDIGRTPYGLAECTPTDVEDDGDEEVVCFTERAYGPEANARRAFALDLDEARDTISLLWTADVPDLVADRNAYVAESASDLDGDSRAEAVHSFYDGTTRSWTTYVRDGASGDELAQWPGAKLAGIVDLDSDGTREVLVTDGPDLQALRFDGSLTSLWTLEGLTPARTFDRSAMSTRGPIDAPLVIDTEAGRALLLRPNDDADFDTLRAIAATSDPPAELARYDAPADTDFTVFSSITQLQASVDPAALVVAATSDARLITLDSGLHATNRIDDPEFPVLGARHGGVPLLATGAGGLPAFPLAADGDGDGASEIVTGDAAGAMSLRDARDATMTVEPSTIWSVPRAGYAAFFDMPDGSMGTVVQSDRGLEAFAANGSPLWSAQLPDADPDDSFSQDILPFPLPNGGSGLFVNRGQAGTIVVQGLAISASDGSPLWDDWIDLGFAADPPRPAAWADLEGTPEGVIVTSPAGNALAGFGADTGIQVRSRAGAVLGMPVILDVDDDGSPEVLETAQSSLALVDSSFANVWSVENETRLANFGALARCPAPTWVTGLASGPEIRGYELEGGSLVASAFLGEGRSFVTREELDGSGVRSGSLRAVTVAPTLEDPDRDVALVGSSDGHLYAVDPCSLALRWAIDLGASVVEAVPADTAGDGHPVIMATVGDGYVYGLVVPEVPIPGRVLDIDPPSGITDEDVDEIDTVDTLYGSWEGVPGADYEVSVFTSDLAPVSDDFVPVGESTQASVSGLDLRLGVTYLFSVRSRSGSRVSPESVSDGVLVVDRTPPVVEITADPDTIPVGGGTSSLLTVTATDGRGLAHLTVRVIDPSGRDLGALLDSDVTGPSREWSEPWAPLSEDGTPLPAGNYVAVAEATDVSGLAGSAAVTIQVVDTEHGTYVRGGGCDCDCGVISRNQSASPRASVAPLLLVVLCLLHRRARKRRN